jgi:hypothetical protein
MKRYVVFLVLLQLIGSNRVGLASDIVRTEEINKTLRFGGVGGERLVIVDNVFGSIDVTGYDGGEVRVIAHKTITARSDEKLEEALEEVTLEITEEDDVIELYVDGPFRDKRRDRIEWRGSKDAGYKVTYDFEIEMPRNCAVELKTVNGGDISVRSIEGDFEVNNVNGGIEMKGLRGSGIAYTVNGEVSLWFEANPRGNCRFGTINGDVRLYFQPGLSADIYLTTMNGEVFTDFEVGALPARTKTTNSRDGKKVYQVRHTTGVRAGRGGPEFELNTLNGDMFILSR